jgi:predicted DCC family thiol-disulfide oxidoreductase YuxK
LIPGTTGRRGTAVKKMPPDAPLLIYDGECNFCKRWVARWKKWTGERVTYRPLQEIGEDIPEIAKSTLEASVHLVEPDGRIFRGADAVFRTLEYTQPKPKFLWLRLLPGFMPLARFAYDFIARRRSLFSRFS